MTEEWNYLNQEVAPSDLPIADKMWENIPHMIDEKTITVSFYLQDLKFRFICLRIFVLGQKPQVGKLWAS